MAGGMVAAAAAPHSSLGRPPRSAFPAGVEGTPHPVHARSAAGAAPPAVEKDTIIRRSVQGRCSRPGMTGIKGVTVCFLWGVLQLRCAAVCCAYSGTYVHAACMSMYS